MIIKIHNYFLDFFSEIIIEEKLNDFIFIIPFDIINHPPLTIYH